jgi:hypothetical protein
MSSRSASDNRSADRLRTDVGRRSTAATYSRTVVCGRPTVRAINRTGNLCLHNSAISALSASVSFLTTSLTIDRT